MNVVLIDTPAAIWLAEDAPELSARGRELIDDPSNEWVASVASVWEMAIKVRLGKLKIKSGTLAAFVERAKAQGIAFLSISTEDALGVGELAPSGHKDPFDRLIASQCLRQGMALLSVDVCFDAYGVTRVW